MMYDLVRYEAFLETLNDGSAAWRLILGPDGKPIVFPGSYGVDERGEGPFEAPAGSRIATRKEVRWVDDSDIGNDDFVAVEVEA